jgi:cation:H+ antiporter
VTILGVHPASAILLGLYAFGVIATSRIREQPMWRPVSTRETREDTPDEAVDETGEAIRPVAIRFVILLAILGVAGYTIAQAGARIADAANISDTAVGSILTAISTSLPELVTTVAAVRRGAAQLAVGGIIGGNAFDILFLTLADVAYRDGSLYHAIGASDMMWVGVGLAMTTVLLMGLIARERSGPANIGAESVAMLTIYGGAVAVQVFFHNQGSTP